MQHKKQVKIVDTRLVREKTVLYQSKNGSRKIEEPKDVMELMTSFLCSRGREEVYVICLDGSDTPVAISKVFIGTNNLSICSTADVVKLALLTNSPYLILVHTHPSGSTTPSRQDDVLTQKLIRAGKLFDIELHDHIIIGDSGNEQMEFYSYREEDRLEWQ